MLKQLDNGWRCVVHVLVEMLAPYKGRVYDPCCGSAGMFVQSEKFVEEHGGRSGAIAIYGQESSSKTRWLAMMNLAIRGIEADFGPENADTLRSKETATLPRCSTSSITIIRNTRLAITKLVFNRMRINFGPL